MTSYAISADVAWLEAAEAGGPEQVVWAAHLDSGAQFAFTDTGWLIWMLLADGVADPDRLCSELERIHGELGAQAGAENFDRTSLEAFLADLAQNDLVHTGP